MNNAHRVEFLRHAINKESKALDDIEYRPYKDADEHKLQKEFIECRMNMLKAHLSLREYLAKKRQ